MEIFVFPGCDGVTRPRLPPEKSISRNGSATTFFIQKSLSPVGPPRRNDSVRLGLTVGVHHNEHLARCTHSQGDEALFANGIRVFTRQCLFVVEHGSGVGEPHSVRRQVGLCLPGIPFEPLWISYGQLSTASRNACRSKRLATGSTLARRTRPRQSAFRPGARGGRQPPPRLGRTQRASRVQR